MTPLWQPLLVVVVAAIVTWLADRWLLGWLLKQEISAQIREDGPASHQAKAKTPALGGAVFPIGWLIGLGTGLVLEQMTYGPWLALAGHRATLALVILVPVLMFMVGFADDWLKVAKKSSEGLKARFRFPLQLLLGLLLALAANALAGDTVRHFLPIPHLQLALLPSMLLIIWITLFFAGTVNGVNFTDGLDTLLAGTGLIALILLGMLSYGWVVRWVATDPVLGHAAFAGAGVLLGFYPLNRHPAKLFMGDGGAYFIGALLATIAVLQGTTFCFLIIGAVFFIELLSVILQVTVFRLTGGKRRLFPMAPLHHSFEKMGWAERDVVTLFWGVGLLLGLLGLWLVRQV